MVDLAGKRFNIAPLVVSANVIVVTMITFVFRLQIDSHVKRLDEDLNNFSEDLKQGM